MNKNLKIAVVGCVLIAFGLISTAVLPGAFPRGEIYDGYAYTTMNMTYMYLGFGMLVVGGSILFYGYYKYKKEEENEYIEKIRKTAKR